MTCTPTTKTVTIPWAADTPITLNCAPLGNAIAFFYANTLHEVPVTFTDVGTVNLPHNPPAALKRVIGEKFSLTHPLPIARRIKLTLPYDNTGVPPNKAQVWIVDPVGWTPVPTADHVYVNGRLTSVWLNSIAASGEYVVVEIY